jgi:hypothetical protein
MVVTEIPKGDYDSPAPCWLPIVDTDGNKLKPVIKCKCGQMCGIRLHHVHADGRVTNSFWHYWAERPNDGCGWHVWLKLLDYDQGEFLPGAK